MNDHVSVQVAAQDATIIPADGQVKHFIRIVTFHADGIGRCLAAEDLIDGPQEKAFKRVASDQEAAVAGKFHGVKAVAGIVAIAWSTCNIKLPAVEQRSVTVRRRMRMPLTMMASVDKEVVVQGPAKLLQLLQSLHPSSCFLYSAAAVLLLCHDDVVVVVVDDDGEHCTGQERELN